MIPGLLLTLLMGRVRSLWSARSTRSLLLLLPWRIPVRCTRIGRAWPLVRGARRRSAWCTRWAAWSRTVVRAPLRLGLGSLRGILTAVLALALPTARIHGSLLIGRVRLLVFLKVGMSPRLVRLILSVIVRLLGPLRRRSRIATLGARRRWLSSGWPTGTSGPGWTLAGRSGRSRSRWRLGRACTLLTLGWWWLLLVGSLLRWWRIRATSVAPVRIGSGSGWR